VAVDTSAIGSRTGRAKVVIERGPVSNFARALKDENPVYHRPDAARAAGFGDIPAPPTWAFCMEYWGKFPEIQPEDKVERSAMMEVIGKLMQKGGLVLHGEQEFEYHRPAEVGDVLVSEGKIADIYERESKGRTMTFVVSETVWSDDRTGEPVLTMRTNILHRS
jgi:hypothetical protein